MRPGNQRTFQKSVVASDTDLCHSFPVMNPNESKSIRSQGLQGLFILLDASQIYPNEPGRGCPVLVHRGGCEASFRDAINKSRLLGPGGDIEPLDAADLAWLESVEDQCAEFYSRHLAAKRATHTSVVAFVQNQLNFL